MKPSAVPLLHPSMLRLSVPDPSSEQTAAAAQVDAATAPAVPGLASVSHLFPSFNQQLAGQAEQHLCIASMSQHLSVCDVCVE